MSLVPQCIWIKYFNVCVSAIVKLLRVLKMVFNSAPPRVSSVMRFQLPLMSVLSSIMTMFGDKEVRLK